MKPAGLVRLIFAIAISTSALLAQDASAGQKTRQDRMAEAIDKLSRVTRVTGLVVDDHTGKPLSGATVRLTVMVMHSSCFGCNTPPTPPPKPDPPRKVVTGSDGSFEFDNVQASKSLIKASKPDYMEVWPMHANEGGIHPMGDSTGQILLRLMPLASITGVLLDHEGMPIAKVWNVALFHVGNLNGWSRTGYSGPPKYAGDGTYSFHGLTPGRYYMVAEPLRKWVKPPRDAAGHAIGEVPVRYPAFTAQNPSTFFTLHEGEQAHIDLRFHEERLYRVTGTGGPVTPVSCNIVGANGGIFRPNELIEPVNGSDHFSDGSPDRSRFEAWLPNGSYRICNEITGSTSFEVADSDLPDLNVTIGPQYSTWVKVPIEISSVAPPGSSGPGAGPDCGFVLVNLVRILPGGYGEQSPVFSGDVGPGCSSSQQAESRSWTPGIYTAEVLVSTNLYAKSITSGRTDLAVGPLVVRPGESPNPIRVVLAEGALVDGIVDRDGKPARAWVYAVAENIDTKNDFRLFQPVFSDEDGEFHISGLAPGSYFFFASDIELALNVHDPAETAYWRSHGKIVRVQAGKTTKVALTPVDPPDEP